MTNDCHITDDRALTRSMVWKRERLDFELFTRQQNPRAPPFCPPPREGACPIMKINPPGDESGLLGEIAVHKRRFVILVEHLALDYAMQYEADSADSVIGRAKESCGVEPCPTCCGPPRFSLIGPRLSTRSRQLGIEWMTENGSS